MATPNSVIASVRVRLLGAIAVLLLIEPMHWTLFASDDPVSDELFEQLPTSRNSSPTRLPEVFVPKDKKPNQSTSGNGSPVITQGPGSIAQVGNNNSATIINGQRLSFTDAQRAQFSAALRRFSDRRVKVFVDQITPETGAFADQLVAAFRDAGVAVVEYNKGTQLFLDRATSFVYMYVNTESPGMLEFAEAIGNAMGQLGLIRGNLDADRGSNSELVIYIRRP